MESALGNDRIFQPIRIIQIIPMAIIKMVRNNRKEAFRDRAVPVFPERIGAVREMLREGMLREGMLRGGIWRGGIWREGLLRGGTPSHEDFDGVEFFRTENGEGGENAAEEGGGEDAGRNATGSGGAGAGSVKNAIGFESLRGGVAAVDVAAVGVAAVGVEARVTRTEGSFAESSEINAPMAELAVEEVPSVDTLPVWVLGAESSEAEESVVESLEMESGPDVDAPRRSKRSRCIASIASRSCSS